MLRRPRQLHLVHRVVLAEKLPTFPTIYLAICRVETFPAEGLRTNIVRTGLLPMGLSHHLVWIDPWWFW